MVEPQAAPTIGTCQCDRFLYESHGEALLRPRMFIIAKHNCNATSAQACSGKAQATHRILLAKKVQKPQYRLCSRFDPTNHAATTEVANAGHCKSSIQFIATLVPYRVNVVFGDATLQIQMHQCCSAHLARHNDRGNSCVRRYFVQRRHSIYVDL